MSKKNRVIMCMKIIFLFSSFLIRYYGSLLFITTRLALNLFSNTLIISLIGEGETTT